MRVHAHIDDRGVLAATSSRSARLTVLGDENDEDAGKFYDGMVAKVFEKATWSASKPITINGFKGREKSAGSSNGVIVIGFADPKASAASSRR
jgi:hypothetical protein